MPFLAPDDALNAAFVDMEELAADLGPPPWRAGIIATESMRVVLLYWPAGYHTVPHVHPGAEEAFQVLRGRAIFTIGDEPERKVGPGEFVLAARGVPHAIGVTDDGPLLLLATVAPNEDRPDEQVETV
jgi:quercetin dioxygenase-like cupin family protein